MMPRRGTGPDANRKCTTCGPAKRIQPRQKLPITHQLEAVFANDAIVAERFHHHALVSIEPDGTHKQSIQQIKVDQELLVFVSKKSGEIRD